MTVYAPPPATGSTVLYTDDAFLITDKPAGLLSVPGRGEDKHDCLIHRVQETHPEALIVHRLDMSTSGLLILARGEAMQRHFSMLFRERAVDKRYIAVVQGIVEQDVGEIDLPMICDWPNRPRQMVDFERGKPSLTRYRVLERSPAAQTTRVELEPVTGRSHQLRVHMMSLGHPILGDDLYGGIAYERAERLLLHAAQVAFAHPVSGLPQQFECAPPF